MHIETTSRLNNGVEMPFLGFGVYKTPEGSEVENAVRWALELGYRHIDTASFYENEEGVGKAVKASGIDREKLFLTTKVWNSEQGYRQSLEAFDRSRRKLQMDTIDLYLIHWPVKESFKDTWKALEKLYGDGKVRAIGVSNFLPRHIEELMSDFDVVPAVDQVEWHPFLFQKQLYDYCRKHGIQQEAWSPLSRGKYLDNEVLRDIAESHSKTPAQVVLRWDLQHEVVTIPKSVHRERIEENSRIFDFELSSEEMERIDGLDSNSRIGSHPDSLG